MTKGKTNAELLKAMDDMMALPAEEIDTDFAEACLDILQERAPVMEDYDPRAEWEAFRDKHSLLLEPEENKAAVASKRQGFGRKARYGGALVAAVLCLVIAADAAGYHPAKYLIEFLKDSIHIVRYGDPTGKMELPPDDPSEYHSMDEALERNGMGFADRITWIPVDYSLSSIYIGKLSEVKRVYAIYTSERGDLKIDIRAPDKDMTWNGVIESDSEIITYMHGDTLCYISTNYEFTIAGWLDDTYEYGITGNITKDEIKKIIDSVIPGGDASKK